MMMTVSVWEEGAAEDKLTCRCCFCSQQLIVSLQCIGPIRRHPEGTPSPLRPSRRAPSVGRDPGKTSLWKPDRLWARRPPEFRVSTGRRGRRVGRTFFICSVLWKEKSSLRSKQNPFDKTVFVQNERGVFMWMIWCVRALTWGQLQTLGGWRTLTAMFLCACSSTRRVWEQAGCVWPWPLCGSARWETHLCVWSGLPAQLAAHTLPGWDMNTWILQPCLKMSADWEFVTIRSVAVTVTTYQNK